MMPHPFRAPRPVSLLATAALVACGEPKTAPEPFAEIASRYRLVAVNGAALPFAEGGGSWLFERRLDITGDGGWQEFDVYCIQNGQTCPRRERAQSGGMTHSGDGTVLVDYGPAYRAPATLDASGRLEVARTHLYATTVQRTTTYRYQRQ